MLNMPFFSRRVNWGTSARGAWWDTSTLNTTGLWLDGNQLTTPLEFSTEEWHKFIAAMLAFASEEPSAP